MKRVFLLLILFFSTILSVFPQNRTIRGTVTDAITGKPLKGVNVLLPKMEKGVLTNEEGHFKLSVTENDGDILFIYPGKARKVVEISEQAFISVQLGPVRTQIDDEAPFAFGEEKRKYLQPYAFQEISGNSLGQKGTQNIATVLKGKASALKVDESSAMPGASTQLAIRGSNSVFINNTPLIVVDGLPIKSGQGFSGLQNGMDYSSRINDLNIEDIESINILKGASAAALYGSRASNGAVIITTKTGRNLKPGVLQVNVGQSYMVNQVTQLPQRQSQYGQGSTGTSNNSSLGSWGANIAENESFDNLNPLFQDGHTAISHFDLSGRGQKANYNLALSYVDQEGIIPFSGMNRITGKFGAELDLKKLKIGVIANAVLNDFSKLDGGNNTSGVVSATYLSPPNYDLWGTDFGSSSDPDQQGYYNTRSDNPAWSLVNNQFKESTERLFGTAYLNYKPSSWLELHYRGGGDVFYENINEYYALGSAFTSGRTNPPSGGRIIEGQNYVQELNSNFNARFSFGSSKAFGFDLLLGNEIVDTQIQSNLNIGDGFAEAGTQDIANTNVQKADTVNFNNRIYGFYANASFSIFEILYLDLAARQDYISNVSYDNSQFIYPSAGLSFVFSQLLEENNFLKIGKLSANYSEVGKPLILNQKIRNQLSNGLDNPYFSPNRTGYPFRTQEGYFNVLEDLTPQITETIDFGLQLALFNNQLAVNANYFKESNTNQYLFLPLPASTGINYELRNTGEIQNTGIEASVSFSPIKTTNFEWNVSGNYTSIESEVIAIAENSTSISLGNTSESPEIRMLEGASFPLIYGSSFLRNDDGRLLVDNREFVNGSANSAFGMPIQDPEQKVLGKINPDFWAAVSSSIRVFGLSMHVQFDGQFGGHTYTGSTKLQKEYGVDITTEDREEPVILDAVKGYYSVDGNGSTVINEEGENNIVINKGEYFWSEVMANIDEAHVYENNFIRLREAKIGYTIDHSKGGEGFFKKTNIYVVGRNLWMMSSLPNSDPETNWNGSSPYYGQQYFHFPQMRSFGGGINLTF